MTQSVSRGDSAVIWAKEGGRGTVPRPFCGDGSARPPRCGCASAPHAARRGADLFAVPRTARPAQSRRMRAGVPPRRVARGPHGFPGRFAARRRERAHGRVHAAFFRVRLPASPCGGTHAPQLGLRSPSERPPVQNSFPSNDVPSSTWSILPAGPAGASRDVIPSDRLIVPPAARPFSSAGTA